MTSQWKLFRCLGIAGLCTAALLIIGCDEDKKAASTEPPTPEKIAGMHRGAMRYCVVSTVAGNSMDVDFEWDDQHQALHLEKTDKGFCGYDTINPLKISPRLFIITPPEDAKASEVGVYYLPEAKENPKADDLKYQKLEPIKGGKYLLIVQAKNEVPAIQVYAPIE